MKTADEIMGLATQAIKEQMTRNKYLIGGAGGRNGGPHTITDGQKPKGKNVVFVANSHQELMDKLEEIKAERLVRVISRLLIDEIMPKFDIMVSAQENLVINLCQEIAGPKGQPGSPPDPVRLLEMCAALCSAETDELIGALKGDRP